MGRPQAIYAALVDIPGRRATLLNGDLLAGGQVRVGGEAFLLASSEAAGAATVASHAANRIKTRTFNARIGWEPVWQAAAQS